jgi:hypothetical protein
LKRAIRRCFGCASGDFDGQGISYSALQWNFGQGTLQPLLIEMNENHSDVMIRIFGEMHAELSSVLNLPRPNQMTWARSIQTPCHTLESAWSQSFRALGETAEFQTIAACHASSLFNGGLALCRMLGLKSQRAAALMFDIKVQNGGIVPNALTLIEKDFAAIGSGNSDALEIARMRSVANRVADATAVQWREDVRNRKLVAAAGFGVVHGEHYDLTTQFGLTLAPFSGA